MFKKVCGRCGATEAPHLPRFSLAEQRTALRPSVGTSVLICLVRPAEHLVKKCDEAYSRTSNLPGIADCRGYAQHECCSGSDHQYAVEHRYSKRSIVPISVPCEIVVHVNLATFRQV